MFYYFHFYQDTNDENVKLDCVILTIFQTLHKLRNKIRLVIKLFLNC